MCVALVIWRDKESEMVSGISGMGEMKSNLRKRYDSSLTKICEDAKRVDYGHGV